jgi:hypothetical protein
MSYQSPIEVIQTQMRNQIEGEIYKAVMNIGVNVDKEELLKALKYDREQYQKGYADRDSEIVRCKDCVFRDNRDGMCEHVQQVRDPDWYCADGEQRDYVKPVTGSATDWDGVGCE